MSKIGQARTTATSILFLFVATAVLGTGSIFASQVKRPASKPSANPEVSNGATKPLDLPDAALKRQIDQLERARHLLDLSAGNNRTSHSAVAARHIEVAITELKMELDEKAKGTKTAPSGHPASSGTGLSPKRAVSPPISQK
jgi:hypothetical protein